MLGRRENPGEHEAMRKMKNEFMVNWDGLRTKDRERVLVLGATNRPFDLDEAVIRRLPRRFVVSYEIVSLSFLGCLTKIAMFSIIENRLIELIWVHMST